MRTVFLRRSILATSGVALGLAACNAITGLDANYNEVDCFGGSCADATSGDGPVSADGSDSTTPDGHLGSDGSMMPDGSMLPESSTGDGGDSGPHCDPSVVWPPMFAAPIVPPYQMDGLNLRGMDDAGITAAEVIAAACKVFDGGDSNPNLHTVSWGDAGQSSFTYDKTSGRYYSISMNAGYTGALDFTVPDGGPDGGAAAYHIAIGQPITMNGQPYEIDWSGTSPDGGRTLNQELTQLKNAMTAVYAPGTAPSTNCSADGTCLATNNLGTGYFGVRQPLFFYMVFNNDIADPGVPSFFYTINPYPAAYNDFTQAQYWTAFDTTQITGGNVKGAAGVEFDLTALYIVPQGATTPVARYDTTSDAFTSPASWQTFDVTTLTPKPQGFSGGTFDRYDAMVYFAGTTGISVQYDTSASFTLPGAWSSFDTKTLTPATTAFAGAAEILSASAVAGIADVFVPSQDGVAAMYNGGTGFNTAANWVTFNLATVNARLTKFHGAVPGTGATINPKYLYLVPNADTLFTRWNATLAFNDPTGWEVFDAALLGGAGSFSTGVYDGRYVYFSPGTGGGSVIRYDTTLAFGTASSWAVGLVGMSKINATSWDGRYIYFSGSSANITRYDTTKSFTADPTAWTSVATTGFNPNAVGFVGNTGDGRYLYFVPDTFSTVMRLDDKFPPFGPPRWESLSTY